MEIGDAIRELRKKKGWTQKNLSNNTGLSINSICQIEINNSFPKKESLDIICKSLNIPVAYLLMIPVTHETFPDQKQFVLNTLFRLMNELLIGDIKYEKI